ncbi:DUF933 domain-containing protein [Candidatus Parvarchaeota archaeon]|nr:DUF933 domain-containing protein [Candidatus Parvarchaeota archaeon]
MLIGVVGAPNKGKSTFFAACTESDVQIADYPFTTIDPNKGVTYARVACPHTNLGVMCSPRTGKCINGTRMVPVNIIDVAGLVPGAHEGKGMGNKFLDDLRGADALIQVVDATGNTDLEGNRASGCDPAREIEFLEQEISYWIAGIMMRNWAKIKGRGVEELQEALSGLKVQRSDIEAAAASAGLTLAAIEWNEKQALDFASALRKRAKKILIAANKADAPGAPDNIGRLKNEFGERVVACSAIAELALRKAGKTGAVEYSPGQKTFLIKNCDERQKKGLGQIAAVMERQGGTGVQQAIDKAVFELLGLIPVFPVEDEHKYCNNFGAVLPDAILVKKGTSASELAGLIHTDLAKHFICAINARTHMKIGKEHVLEAGDVIKIVSGRG